MLASGVVMRVALRRARLLQHPVTRLPMKVLVLGSQGAAQAPQRTQSSVALSADGASWLLLNASPDIGQQIRATPALHARRGVADTAVKAVVLMDAQIDHVAGLLSLRAGAPLELYATPSVFEGLSSGLPLLQTFQHHCGVRWRMVPVAGEARVAAFRVAGFDSLSFTAIATGRDDHTVGDSIALYVEDSVSGRSLFYSPGPQRPGDDDLAWRGEADCLLLDTTLEAALDGLEIEL